MISVETKSRGNNHTRSRLTKRQRLKHLKLYLEWMFRIPRWVDLELVMAMRTTVGWGNFATFGSLLTTPHQYVKYLQMNFEFHVVAMVTR